MLQQKSTYQFISKPQRALSGDRASVFLFGVLVLVAPGRGGVAEGGLQPALGAKVLPVPPPEDVLPLGRGSPLPLVGRG